MQFKGMDGLLSTLTELEGSVELQLKDVPRWELILGTISLTSGIVCLYDVIKRREDIIPYLKKTSLQLVMKVPYVQNKIREEMANTKHTIREAFYEEDEKTMKSFLELPPIGKSREEVLEYAMPIFKIGKFKWKNGKVSGGVMTGSSGSYTDLMTKMYGKFAWSNPLHVDVFPGIRKMEAEIIRMTASIFHGDENTVGCMTSGGTESLVMAMKAYRDWGKNVKGIKHPEVVGSCTVHAAIDKGCDIMGVKFRKVKTNPKTFKVNVAGVRKAINKNTVMIVASAPDYAHGIIDDIEELSKIALRNGIPLHVDCCLGGYILPFMDAAGYPLQPFDFRVPGVTSISADTHKYGNAPKGSSVVLYRNKEYRHHQYFVAPDWPGGIYATPTIPGSRAGAHIAMCWAALLYFGAEGYVEVTRKIIRVARKLKREINEIDGLQVLGDPLGPVVSFCANGFNILEVADVMVEYGWHLQPLQNPPCMHVFLTSLHTGEGIADNLLQDLRKAVQKVRGKAAGNTEGWAKLYGSANAMPKSILEDAAKMYLETYYTSVKEHFVDIPN